MKKMTEYEFWTEYEKRVKKQSFKTMTRGVFVNYKVFKKLLQETLKCTRKSKTK